MNRRANFILCAAYILRLSSLSLSLGTRKAHRSFRCRTTVLRFESISQVYSVHGAKQNRSGEQIHVVNEILLLNGLKLDAVHKENVPLLPEMAWIIELDMNVPTARTESLALRPERARRANRNLWLHSINHYIYDANRRISLIWWFENVECSMLNA